MAMEI